MVRAGAAAEQSLRSWGRTEPGDSYWPLTFALTLLVSRWLAAQGWWYAAAAVVVAHRCLLRVGDESRDEWRLAVSVG